MRAAAVVAAALTLSACLLPHRREITTVDVRAAVLGLDLGALSPDRRAAIERGEVWVGATAVEAYLARGRPSLWWRTRGQAGSCEVLAHASLTDPSRADTAVTVCDGVVAQLAPISPPVPCWRLAEVGPRLVTDGAYFDELAAERQWQIVLGILQRGQRARDVAIAFGTPYRRGVDEREDGVRADEQLFLDASGDAYGLRVTFIDDRVAGWKVPAERTLTPEAEQRRLDAVEQRLTSKLRELEARSIAQHAATLALFAEVMDKQDSMMATLTRPAPAPPPPGPPPAGGGGGVSGRPAAGDAGAPGGPGPGSISVTHTTVTTPWGQACREGGDQCRPGMCARLTSASAAVCTAACKTDRDCPAQYYCGFELAMTASGQPVQRGMRMCRPR
ncbi:MAG: hypothetical protein R3B06_26870 [Kofleriaceae bacterium]